MHEEHDAPEHILLGATNSRYCILLNLAIYLETWCELGQGIGRRFMFTDDNDDGAAIQVKNSFSRMLQSKAFKNVNFENLCEGQTGTHSLQKLASTFASQNGCAQTDVEARGCWRGAQRVVNCYIDTETPYIDAKVAAVLCLGGPIKYKLEEESGVTDKWLLENVTAWLTNLHTPLQNRVSKVLALPLL